MRHVLTCGGLEFFAAFDILCLTETFQLTSTSIQGFYCHESLAGKGEAGRPYGGVLVGIKPGLNARMKNSSPHHVAVELEKLNVVCCYYSPTVSVDDLLEDLMSALGLLDLRKPTLLGGDFNARLDIPNVAKTNDLTDALADFGFLLFNKPEDYTFRASNNHGTSTIDLAFGTLPLRVQVDCSSKVSSLRRHLPVIIKCDSSRPTPPEVVRSRVSRKLIPELLDLLDPTDIERFLTESDSDAAYAALVSSLLNSTSAPAPPIAPSRFIERDRDCVRLRRRVLSLHHLIRCRPWLWEELAVAKREYSLRLRVVKEEQRLREEDKRLAEAEKFPWKLNPRRNGSFNCPLPLEAFTKHFKEVFQSTENIDVAIDPEWLTSDEGVLNRDFTEGELLTCLRSCGDRKATGLDDIANEHLKGSFPVLGPLWVMLFNLILSSGSIVEAWKQSIVSVLYKGKGDPADPNSYRGIAWLSHPFKWLTKCLATRIYSFVINRTMPEEQHGFIRGKSTTLAIGKLREAVINRENPLYAVFVDFKKAFDSVPRRLLIWKLVHLHNIRGRILRCLLAIYSVNFIRLFDGLSFSVPMEQDVGVLQGDSLSPLMFILFLADLPSALLCVRDLTCLLYADDLVIFSESIESVQKAVDVLFFYCKENGLQVNVSKTKAMKFRRGGKLKRSDIIKFGEVVLEFCDEYEYLGVVLQQTWTFTRHFKKKYHKYLTRLNQCRNLRDLSLSGAVRYFDCLLKPIVVYGLEPVWPDLKEHHFELIDKFKWTFFKRVLSVHMNTRNRLVCLLSGLPCLSEELGLRFGVTPELQNHLEAFQEKMFLVDPDVFLSPAFVQSAWKCTQSKKRHLSVRVSVHGFHFKFCRKKNCFDRSDSCTCRFCQLPAGRLLHALECPFLSLKGLDFVDNLEV